MTAIESEPAQPDLSAASYRLRLLGSFALERPDGSSVLGLGRKARALIAVVALAEAPVERTRLAELLWSDRGADQARASLRQTFYELRQQLPAQPPLLIVNRDSVCLARQFVDIDVEATSALPSDDVGHQLLGDLDHTDLRFDRWLLDERARLRQARSLDKITSEPPLALGDSLASPLPLGAHRYVQLSKLRALKWLLSGGALAVILGMVGLIAVSPHSAKEMDRVVTVQALLTARGDTSARTLADGLAMAVERDVVGTGTPVRIADAPAATRPALILRGNATSNGGLLRANLALVGADGTVIWSGTFERPVAEVGAMLDQLALQVARELHFAFANGRNAIFDRDPEAIRLSLAAGDAVGRDFSEAARYSAQTIKRAPLFARGWAELAVNTVEAAQDLPERARADADRAAAADARRALAIDPHQGLAYFALVESRPGLPRWNERERIISRGLAADPDSAELNVSRADDFAAIGRLQEAMEYSQRAFSLDHFLPGKVAVLARRDIDVGDVNAARQLIVRAHRMWPDQKWPDALAFELAMYWGDPSQARALLAAGRLPWRQAVHDADFAFLAWREAPSDATAAAAARVIEASARRGAKAELVQQLAAVGQIDAAYRVAAAMPPDPDGDSRWYRGYLASFRADPRFKTVAARQGAVSLWRSTGKWPDFCAEKTLRYRCAGLAQPS